MTLLFAESQANTCKFLKWRGFVRWCRSAERRAVRSFCVSQHVVLMLFPIMTGHVKCPLGCQPVLPGVQPCPASCQPRIPPHHNPARDPPCAPTACSTWNTATLNTQRPGCCFYSIFFSFLCNCKLMSSGIFVTDLYKYTARGKGAGALYTFFLIIVKRTA